MRSVFLALALLALMPVYAQSRTPINYTASTPPPNAIWLDSLNLDNMTQPLRRPLTGRSFDNNPMKLGQTRYLHGLGVHAVSEMRIDLKGAATEFASMVGVDAERKVFGSVRFTVWVDGRKAAETPIMRGGDPPREIRVDLRGAHTMTLCISDGGDGWNYDYPDWAGAMIFLVPGARERPVSTFIPRALPAIPQVEVAQGKTRLWLLPAILIGLAGGSLVLAAFQRLLIRQ